MRRMIGYLRVSTTDQQRDGYGIGAQRATIETRARERGWSMEWREDAASGKSTNRPELERALGMLRAGDADGIVVAKLDRLSRSLLDFLTLVERAQRERWSIVVLNPELDLTTPSGRLAAHVLAAVGEWEREMSGERTREGLAEAKARGVVLGAPRGRRSAGSSTRLDPRTERRILREQAAGRGWSAIARDLNEDEVPTAHRGRAWHATTVRRVALRGD